MEEVVFSVRLLPSNKYAEKVPCISISIDDTVLETTELNEETEYKLTANLEPGTHIISVNLLNKDHRDTICNPEGEIIGDLYVDILSITVNDILINKEILEKSCEYVLDEEVIYLNKTISRIDGNHSFLTWNGAWRFKFSTPFWLWLLDVL